MDEHCRAAARRENLCSLVWSWAQGALSEALQRAGPCPVLGVPLRNIVLIPSKSCELPPYLGLLASVHVRV